MAEFGQHLSCSLLRIVRRSPAPKLLGNGMRNDGLYLFSQTAFFVLHLTAGSCPIMRPSYDVSKNNDPPSHRPLILGVAMRFSFTILVAFVAGLPGVLAQESSIKGTDGDQLQIQQAAEQFVKAYNAHDAKTLATLFATDAELVERDGTRIAGSEEIQAAFADSFEQHPKSKISLNVDSLRFISPGVAVEEGRTAWYPDGVEATLESTYRAAHVKRGDKWLMIGVRTIDDKVTSNYEYLRNLEWLVGAWIDENSEAIVETTFRWAANRTFLLRDYSVKAKGQVLLTGTQRIGWDTQKKQFRSWMFDSEGGFVEGVWTAVGNGYVIRSTGYTSDGTAVSGTTRFDREDKDRFVWSMFNRLRGSEIMPDVSVTVVRKAPPPSVAKK